MISRFLLGRFAQSIVTLIVAVTLIFLVVKLTPGDPVLVILQDHFQKETYDALAARLGLDQPLPVQFVRYVTNLLHGDFGTSFTSGQDVLRVVLEQFPYTFQLAIAAICVAIAIGVPAGLISAVCRNTWADYITMVTALISVCMPGFWLAILLLLVFSIQLGWTPIVGAGDPKDPASLLIHLVLPAFALGARTAALIARITRAAVLEVLHQDYVRTARAKGLAEAVILRRHVLRTALIPMLTVVGLEMGHVLGGSAIIEIVFSRPGIGRILVDALVARDYPQLQGALLFLTCLILIVNLVVDVLYSVADPRIRLA